MSNKENYRELLETRKEVYHVDDELLKSEPKKDVPPPEKREPDKSIITLTEDKKDRALWAELRLDFANSLLNDSSADSGKLDKAIKYFHEAEKGDGKIHGFTEDDFPEEWAAVQNGLGQAYERKPIGDRHENIKKAIEHYQSALDVYKQIKDDKGYHPAGMATVYNNLGVAYMQHIVGSLADNRKKALDNYFKAIQEYIRLNKLDDVTDVQYNLIASGYFGSEYADMVIGFLKDHLENIPHDEKWGIFQNALGNTYHRQKSFTQAIECYTQALEVLQENTVPIQWAVTLVYRGLAYQESEEMTQAIADYESALTQLKPDIFPYKCREAAYHLGRILHEQEKYNDARKVFETAHKAVDEIRGFSNHAEAKRDLSEENADLYARLVHCCLESKDMPENDREALAFEYTVAGKGRAFVDRLASARVDLFDVLRKDTSELTDEQNSLMEDLKPIQELRQKMNILFDKSSKGVSTENTLQIFGQKGTKMPKEIQEIQKVLTEKWEIVYQNHPRLISTQKAPSLTKAQAIELAKELDAVLVEYIKHNNEWGAFVITPESDGFCYVSLTGITPAFLERVFKRIKYFEGHKQGNHQAIIKILPECYDILIRPLNLPKYKKLILAPSNELYLIPLNICFNEQSNKYLSDEYILSFTPNLSSLWHLWRKYQDNNIHQQDNDIHQQDNDVLYPLLAVAYPGKDPNRRSYLHDVIASTQRILDLDYFQTAEKILGSDATVESVIQATRNNKHALFHIACHGSFDVDKPNFSGLVLAESYFTIQQIITELHLESNQLSTLGACVTGRKDVSRSNELVSLQQAFMVSGAKSVGGSLWSVDGKATFALFGKYYELLAKGYSFAKSLQKAMQFVRNKEDEDWNHPYYWGAFQITGLAHQTLNYKQRT